MKERYNLNMIELSMVEKEVSVSADVSRMIIIVGYHGASIFLW